MTEACRAAVLACVERSTNSDGRIVEVNPFADFFSKAMSECCKVFGSGSNTNAIFFAEGVCVLPPGAGMPAPLH